MKRTYPRLFFVKLQMRIDPKPWSFELWLSQIAVQTTHKDTAIKENIFSQQCGNRKAALSHHQLIGLSQVLCGDGRIQTPGDVHRLTALVLYIVRSPEVGIGCSRIADAIRLKFADKE